MSLIARHFEENGLPTVLLGSARDIVEHCRVARFYFTDYPLGNPLGRPYDTALQRQNLHRALELFEAPEPTTIESEIPWGGDGSWRRHYLEIRPEDRERLARMGEERRAARARLRAEGRVRKDR